MSQVAPRPRTTAAQPAAEEKHLLDYVRVIYKRRWIALPVPCPLCGHQGST